MDAESYRYNDAAFGHHHKYLLPAVESILETVSFTHSGRRVFDLGCGNGAVASWLHNKGYDVTGVDPSHEGIQNAQRAYPYLKLFKGSAYDPLAAKYGQFPAVISLEVVEHLYYPRQFAASLINLLEPQGIAIVSTPYHGYFKNLAISVTGKWDKHFTALWDHGHIKFWSEHTLSVLLKEAGFSQVTFMRVGRIPALAKSMIAIAKK